MSDISKKIASLMHERGLTMTDLAKMTGISRSTISRYLSGKVEPKQNSIGLIADALHVNPVWLMGLDVSPDLLVETKAGSMMIQLDKLTPANKAALMATYTALLASQEDENT